MSKSEERVIKALVLGGSLVILSLGLSVFPQLRGSSGVSLGFIAGACLFLISLHRLGRLR